MIQSIMLVLLGFFIAALAVLLLAPAYWRRAVRITTEHLKRSMPMTTAEIRADKDRIRAKYAIKIHSLHKRAERSKLNEARQLIELNRRDAHIYELSQDVHKFKGDLTENQNARRVMEQTINFRLPQIEARLIESKRLLSARDREMIHFVKSAQRHDEILADAKAFHEQQRQEIERLRAALTLQTSRDRGRVRDPGFGAELAIRSEMEALRSRNRDQTGLIERLQTELVRFRSVGGGRSNALADHDGDKATPGSQVLLERNNVLAEEIEALQLKLQGQEDKQMGIAIGGSPAGKDFQVDAQLLQNEVKKLRAQTTAQSDEVEALTAELKAMSSASQDSDKPVVRLTKRVLNAKIGALEKRTERQAETIARLRAELAASNERAARQAASYMKEMRQIGVGPLAQPYEVNTNESYASNGGAAANRKRSNARSGETRNGVRAIGGVQAARSEQAALAKGDGVAINDSATKSGTAAPAMSSKISAKPLTTKPSDLNGGDESAADTTAINDDSTAIAKSEQALARAQQPAAELPDNNEVDEPGRKRLIDRIASGD